MGHCVFVFFLLKNVSLYCSEPSPSMPHILEERNSVKLSFNQCTPPSQGVVLKKRRFRHTLLSARSKNTKRLAMCFFKLLFF